LFLEITVNQIINIKMLLSSFYELALGFYCFNILKTS